MPKRPKAAAAEQQQQQQQQSEEPEQNGQLYAAEDLDLSSDEGEDADAEYSAGESEGDGSDSLDEEDAAEIQDALAEYMAAAEAHRPADASGDAAGPAGTSGRDHDGPVLEDPASDSSEDERPNRNTIGDVPLAWYKDEDHIGYDIEGSKIAKAKRGDKLDALLARNDASGRALRTIYDEYNDEEVVLSKEELKMILRIRKGQFPHVEVNPYEPYIDYYSGDVDPTPLLNAPEPKRRFIPSKWEEQKIVKLVRAIRKGWLKVGKRRQRPQEQPMYLMWGDDDQTAEKSGSGLTYIPAAKPKLPGHEESYNPPKEYLPTEEEKAGWELLPPEERPSYVPQAFSCLRHVPLYDAFIKERFERCLDLYLCPRVRKKRMFIDPKTLVPKLPKPRDLQPFPNALSVTYSGHTGRVRSISPHPGGQWLASGSDDGSLRVWEVSTGRCACVWQLGEAVVCVAWCPDPKLQLLAAAVGSSIVLLPVGVTGDEVEAAAKQACSVPAAVAAAQEAAEQQPLAKWVTRADGGMELRTGHAVRHLAWHARGDYFASVAPTGNTQSVLVHQLSRFATQNPFRKNRGRVMRVAFHPAKPFFFVATQNAVRIYNLAKQALAKKLVGSSGVISCMAIHPSGDHVILGSEDKRLAWYDLDLSAKPYKALRYHTYAVRGAAFHNSYPLFASSSDDGTAHVFHGRVYADLMTNPLIVPVKILRGHKVVNSSGVLDCAFHPTQPWLFTAGADGDVLLWCN